MQVINLDVFIKSGSGLRGSASKVYINANVAGRTSKRKTKEAVCSADASRAVTFDDAAFPFDNLTESDFITFKVKAQHMFRKDTVGSCQVRVSEALEVVRAGAPRDFPLDNGGALRIFFVQKGAHVDGVSNSDNAQKMLEAPLEAHTTLEESAVSAAPANIATVSGRMTISDYKYTSTDWHYALPPPTPGKPLPHRNTTLRLLQVGFLPKPFMFLAGQKLEMVAELIVGSPLTILRSMWVCFHGKAKGKLANLKMLSTASKEELIMARGNLLGKMQKEQNVDRVMLPVGKHIFYFSVDLPASLPTSAVLKEGKITYKVSVEADIVNHEDLVASQFVSVINSNDLSTAAAVTAPVSKSNSKNPMGSGGPVTLDCTVVKGAASLDEEFAVKVSVNNASGKTIKKIVTQLRRTVYTNGIPDDINGDTVHEWKYRIQPRVIPGETFNGIVPMEMDELEGSPSDYPPSLKRAKYECCWKLRVKVVLAGSLDLYVDLPVKVCASDPSRPLALRKREPSLDHLAKCMPKHPREWSAKQVQAWAVHIAQVPDLQPALCAHNVDGWDLLGMQPEGFESVAATAKTEHAAYYFRTVTEQLVSAFIASRKMLESLSLLAFVARFEDEGVLECDMAKITEVDLRLAGIPLGPRKRIAAYLAQTYGGAAAKLAAEAEAAAAEGTPAEQ